MDMIIDREELVRAPEVPGRTLHVVRHEQHSNYMEFRVFSTRAKAEAWAAEVMRREDYEGEDWERDETNDGYLNDGSGYVYFFEAQIDGEGFETDA